MHFLTPPCLCLHPIPIVLSAIAWADSFPLVPSIFLPLPKPTIYEVFIYLSLLSQLSVSDSLNNPPQPGSPVPNAKSAAFTITTSDYRSAEAFGLCGVYPAQSPDITNCSFLANILVCFCNALWVFLLGSLCGLVFFRFKPYSFVFQSIPLADFLGAVSAVCRAPMTTALKIFKSISSFLGSCLPSMLLTIGYYPQGSSMSKTIVLFYLEASCLFFSQLND